MSSEPQELTIADVYRLLLDAWVGILVCAVAGGAIAVVLAYTTAPTYRAQTLLAVASTENAGRSALARLAEQFAPVSGMAGGIDTGGGFTGKEVWLATLRSRRLTENFIREKNLLPVLFHDQWDAKAGDWKPGKDGKRSGPSMEKAFSQFDNSVRKVSDDRRTGLITLSIDWGDPHVAADWANDLVRRANEFIRNRTIEESRSSMAFLEGEIRKTNVVELQRVIYALIESKVSSIMLANVRKEYAFSVIDPAVAPEHFVQPRRRFMTAMGLMLGLAAGVLYAGIRWIRKSTR